MCAPTCRGGAYLAASVFIYRSLLLVVTSISCAITGYKMTYLNMPYLEEFMLHLMYFIPLFTASGFALMGIEENSFNFVFFSSMALSTTLFVRYGAELVYIFAYSWTAYIFKIPSLLLNITLDAIFIVILLVYSYVLKTNNGVRHVKEGTAISDTNLIQLSSKSKKSCNLKNSNLEVVNKKLNVPASTSSTSFAIKKARIGYEASQVPALPSPRAVNECRELDDISLPSPIPLASPECDYV